MTIAQTICIVASAAALLLLVFLLLLWTKPAVRKVESALPLRGSWLQVFLVVASVLLVFLAEAAACAFAFLGI